MRRGAHSRARQRGFRLELVAGLAVVLGVIVAVVVFVTTSPASVNPLSVTAHHPMPSDAAPGYQLDVAQYFGGTAIPNGWHPYQGQAGSDTAGWWDPSHVTVGNGVLSLRAYQDPAHAGPRSPWVEGGIDLWPTGVLTDGEYLVRSRVTSATGVTEVMLLWPNSDNWPPEIDFNESNGTNESTATLTWGTVAKRYLTQSKATPIDLTKWHTWGVIVTPTTITYTVDGKTWATMANHEQVPMHLALQQQVWACGNGSGRTCPSAATPHEVDMLIDWVAIYAPKHAQTGGALSSATRASP
jgi:Glycosyl hydrolases family 16